MIFEPRSSDVLRGFEPCRQPISPTSFRSHTSQRCDSRVFNSRFSTDDVKIFPPSEIPSSKTTGRDSGLALELTGLGLASEGIASGIECCARRNEGRRHDFAIL
jgi:hypothetical protein